MLGVLEGSRRMGHCCWASLTKTLAAAACAEVPGTTSSVVMAVCKVCLPLAVPHVALEE